VRVATLIVRNLCKALMWRSNAGTIRLLYRVTSTKILPEFVATPWLRKSFPVVVTLSPVRVLSMLTTITTPATLYVEQRCHVAMHARDNVTAANLERTEWSRTPATANAHSNVIGAMRFASIDLPSAVMETSPAHSAPARVMYVTRTELAPRNAPSLVHLVLRQNAHLTARIRSVRCLAQRPATGFRVHSDALKCLHADVNVLLSTVRFVLMRNSVRSVPLLKSESSNQIWCCLKHTVTLIWTMILACSPHAGTSSL
jgi:hypothetical protein